MKNEKFIKLAENLKVGRTNEIEKIKFRKYGV